jgi:hypothetical protein
MEEERFLVTYLSMLIVDGGNRLHCGFACSATISTTSAFSCDVKIAHVPRGKCADSQVSGVEPRASLRSSGPPMVSLTQSLGQQSSTPPHPHRFDPFAAFALTLTLLGQNIV